MSVENFSIGNTVDVVNQLSFSHFDTKEKLPDMDLRLFEKPNSGKKLFKAGFL